jgi:hypothetical protein
MNTIAQYIEHGFALVPIPLGQKGPRTSGWNRRENAITSLDRAYFSDRGRLSRRDRGRRFSLIVDGQRGCAQARD